MNEIKSRNRMSAVALKQSENNARLDFIESPKTGKLFFVCGEKRGYISPAVKEKYQNNSLKLEDMQYAECSIDNGASYVPCLMMVGDSEKYVRASF